MNKAQMERVKRVAQQFCAKRGIQDYDTIQDVEGDCIFAAYEAMEKFEGEEIGDGLLVQAAQWACMNGARAAKAEQEVESMDEESGEEMLSLHDFLSSEVVQTPEGSLARDQQLDVLYDFLEGLYRDEYLVLNILYGLDEDYPDPRSIRACAEILGVGRTTVTDLRDRAFAKLRNRGIEYALGLDV